MKKIQLSNTSFSGVIKRNIQITGKNVFLQREASAQKSTMPFFIREFARDKQIGVSKIDIMGLAYAYVLKIPVVSDDSDMLDVAKEFEISAYKTLEVMKLMHNNGLLTMKQIRAIASYWIYQSDTPKSYRRDFKRIFLENPPG